jgi:hypothetical protein
VIRPNLFHRRAIRALLAGACLAVIGLVVAGSASANQYLGALAFGGTASVSGTNIKCLRSPKDGMACYLSVNGKPVAKSWAVTMNDKVVKVGQVGAAKETYTSPAEPKVGGPAIGPGVKQLTVKAGQNFAAVGTHVVCSVLNTAGGTGVACSLVDTKGSSATPVAGAIGFEFISHELQVRTAQGANSKVLFDKKF